MKTLWKFLKPYKKETVLAPLFKMLEASFELFVPLVVAALIDRGIGGGDRGFIVNMGLVLAALGVVGLVASVTAQYFAAKAAVGFSTLLRRALLDKIQRLPYSGIDRIGASTLITRMSSDVNQVQSGVNLTLRLFLRSPFIVLGAMVMAFTIDWKAALVFAVVIPVLSVIVFGIMFYTIPLYRGTQTSLDSVLSQVRENLTGVRVLRAFDREYEEISEFDRKTERLSEAQRFVGRISAVMNPATYLVVNAGLIALLWTGALRVEGGVITQGALIALVNYLSQILVELVKLANLIITLTRAMACWGRVTDVLDAPDAGESARESSDAKTAKAGAPAVEFDGVSVRYERAGAEALTGLTLRVNRAEAVGVIGGTGSGKTTLVNLIPRFYDVTGGAVKVNGVDVRDYQPEDLRRMIGVVPQHAELFEGTVKSNLAWGKADASEEEMEEALKTAQALSFVMEKPEGLNAKVAQRGKNLSGGQRQRLTIARALVRKPQILILDDSASALDYATDAALRHSIRSIKDMTVFIVSQRAASVMYLDKIVVLDDGRVAGQGTHRELLENCPVYQEIYYSQYPKEA